MFVRACNGGVPVGEPDAALAALELLPAGEGGVGGGVSEPCCDAPMALLTSARQMVDSLLAVPAGGGGDSATGALLGAALLASSEVAE